MLLNPPPRSPSFCKGGGGLFRGQAIDDTRAARVGILQQAQNERSGWIPAFAGMTTYLEGMTPLSGYTFRLNRLRFNIDGEFVDNLHDGSRRFFIDGEEG
jgi:hypothetical protein